MSEAGTLERKSKLIRGAVDDWEVVIGLEVHAQVTSNAKLFSGAATAFGGAPNSHVSFVDAAMPGMLPVINRECVAQAVRTGIGRLMAALSDAGLAVRDVSTAQNSLEDIFVTLVAEQAAEQETAA